MKGVVVETCRIEAYIPEKKRDARKKTRYSLQARVRVTVELDGYEADRFNLHDIVTIEKEAAK